MTPAAIGNHRVFAELSTTGHRGEAGLFTSGADDHRTT